MKIILKKQNTIETGGVTMRKRVYVSADWREPYDTHSWDKEVVDRIRKWGEDSRYGVDLICTDDFHNSVTKNNSCRRCDINQECENQIKLSDVVIFVVGDKTATKNAGPCDGVACSPAYSGSNKSYCIKSNKWNPITDWKKMSYLEYEITVAVRNNIPIILVFNSANKRESWIPSWYDSLCDNFDVDEIVRIPFWTDSAHTKDCYQDIKEFLL